MQINKLYRKYGFAKNGWPHLYKDHISSCSSSERSQAIFAYKHEFTFQKKVVAVFPLWFLFPIQMRCTDRRIWKNRIPRIASKSILLSLWLTSSLLREDGSHHIFSQYLESFFACLELDLGDWFIQLGISFFSAQLPLSEKSISWQCKASFALVYNTRI